MQQRKYNADRNKLWDRTININELRISDILQERERLQEETESMQAAKDEYNSKNAVSETDTEDLEKGRKWEAYMNLETDEAAV